MATHPAVVTVAVRGPLEILQVPTISPAGNEVRLRVEWTASTPLDLHQNDGGLLVTHPQILGDGVAGTVIECGPEVKKLKTGDKVFGFTWRNKKEKAHQLYCTTPENLLGILPEGWEMKQAVTLGNNFVTAWHTIVTDLRLELPWPKPEGYAPERKDSAILIWGGSSSVGQYAIQVLRFYGYTNIMATASPRNHALLKDLGATHIFDYNDAEIVKTVLGAAGTARPSVPFILDCIGSRDWSIRPLAKIAQSGTRAAVLLPVVVRDPGETKEPEYSMDVPGSAEWAEGVVPIGVRTHFYPDNPFHAEHLQPTIMPAVLAQGIVKPNRQRIVEGASLLERAQAAMDALRRKELTGSTMKQW